MSIGKGANFKRRNEMEFYNKCRFTYGVSLDHIILEKNKLWDNYKPQMNDYIVRALDPSNAPSYGVPGDK